MIFSWPVNSQDLFVNSPLYLLPISLSMSSENLVLDQDNNLYLMSLSILITCLLDNVGDIIERSYKLITFGT